MHKFRRIILIEDDEPTLLYSKMVLEHIEQVELELITSWSELSDFYSKNTTPSKDLILLDINLSNDHASEILLKLNKHENYTPQNTKIILLSSFFLEEDYNLKDLYPEIIKFHEKPLVLSMIEELAEELVVA